MTSPSSPDSIHIGHEHDEEHEPLKLKIWHSFYNHKLPKVPLLEDSHPYAVDIDMTSEEEDIYKKAFLVRLGKALHNSGAPVHRTEYQMTFAAQALGIQGAFIALPTVLMITFGDEYTGPVKSESHAYKVFPSLDCEKMYLLATLADKICRKKLDAKQGTLILAQIEKLTGYYPRWVRLLAFGISSAAISGLFFKGLWPDIGVSFALGLLVGLVKLFVADRFVFFGRVFEPAAGLIVSFFSRIVDVYLSDVVGTCYLSRTLSAVVWFLPGLSLTIAITELATKNLVSGSTRMFGALLVALQLGFGMTIGDRLVFWEDAPATNTCVGLSPWYNILFLTFTVLPFLVLLNAHPHQWIPMIVASFVGYLVNFLCQMKLKADISISLAAFSVGITGGAYGYLTKHPPMVSVLAGIILLVPGSLGVKGFHAFIENDALSGIAITFQMIYTGLSITVGLFLANLIAFPRHALTPDNTVIF